MNKLKNWSMMILIVVLMPLLAILLCSCSSSNDSAGDNDFPVGVMEETINNLETICNSVNSLFLQSNTFKEFSLYFNDFESLEGVEKAWEEDSTLFISVKNGGVVFWTFNQDDDGVVDISQYLQINSKMNNRSLTRSASDDKDICENTNVLVLNQQSNDILRDSYKIGYKSIKDHIENTPAYTSFDYKEAVDFTLNFLRYDMPKYGVIFMITHGVYCKRNNHHWFLTGEIALWDKTSYRKWTDAWCTDRVAIGYLKEFWRNVVYGSSVKFNVPYLCFSEEFIKNEMNPFCNNSILFNTACQSLKNNENVWAAFKTKGLGCYLGYTDDNTKGKEAGCVFIENMFLSTQTVEVVYDNLCDYYKIEAPAILKCCPSRCPIRINKGINLCPDDNHPHMIDLGLPSGTKWSCCNVGATKPEEFGDYYEWGSIKKVDRENEDDDEEEDDLPENISGTQYDVAAYLKLGKMPDFKTFYELEDNCTIEWTEMNGVIGALVIGKNGNSLFLPAAGSIGYHLGGVGNHGSYWSSELKTTNTAYYWLFSSYWRTWDENALWVGCTIRPVAK